MRRLTPLLLTALLYSCSLFQPSFTPLPQQILTGKASYVIDGSTFYFSFDKGKFKSRLSGVATPAMTERFGRESFEFLRGLIHQKNVKIQYLKTDAEGRWVVYAYLETGENISQKVQEFQRTLPDVPEGHPPVPTTH